MKTFKNSKGEVLTLDKIFKRDITSITFTYLSKKKTSKVGRFLLLLIYINVTKDEQEEITVTIKKEEGYILFCDKKEQLIFIYFSSEKEYSKIPDDNYDDKTVSKQTPSGTQYLLRFLISNLKSIEWI